MEDYYFIFNLKSSRERLLLRMRMAYGYSEYS